jgi:hypothetical protein
MTRLDRPTQPPPFDPQAYARHSERQLAAAPVRFEQKPTEPPDPLHGSLRDSCKDLRVAPAAEAPLPRPDPSRVPAATLDSVVVLLVAPSDLPRFRLDRRAQALLSLVDGEMIVEEILAITDTDPKTGLAIFTSLARAGLVAFGRPSSVPL